jgi:type II secretory pathway pseudopilin PulG
MSRIATLVRRRDEDGVALVLAVVVMVVIGLMSAAILATITSGVRNRGTLDNVRDREYAADAAIEAAIANLRNTGANPGFGSCAPSTPTFTVNDVTVRVGCTNVPRITQQGFLQRNVVFVTCEDTGAACDDDSGDERLHTIVRAQVNFEVGPSSPTVTKTYVQAWSVNR